MLMNQSASDFEEEKTESVRISFPDGLGLGSAQQVGENDESFKDDGTQELEGEGEEIEESGNGEWTPKGANQRA